MKTVSEMCGARVHIVLSKKGELVAKVHARYGSGGAVQVDIHQYGEPAKKTAATLGLPLGEYGEAPDAATLQQRKAGGYGYDKYAAALSGMVIDGIRLSNHCGTDKATERLLKRYSREVDAGKSNGSDEVWRERAKKIGARFANWNGPSGYGGAKVPRYVSLHRLEGLAYMEAMGYRVIEAL